MPRHEPTGWRGYSFSGAARAVRPFAHLPTDQGVSSGARIAIQSEKSSRGGDSPIWGCSPRARVAVPLDLQLTPEETGEILATAEATHAIVSRRSRTGMDAARRAPSVAVAGESRRRVRSAELVRSVAAIPRPRRAPPPGARGGSRGRAVHLGHHRRGQGRDADATPICCRTWRPSPAPGPGAADCFSRCFRCTTPSSSWADSCAHCGWGRASRARAASSRVSCVRTSPLRAPRCCWACRCSTRSSSRDSIAASITRRSRAAGCRAGSWPRAERSA